MEKDKETNTQSKTINDLMKQISIASLEDLDLIEMTINHQIIILGQYIDYEPKNTSVTIMKLDYTEDNDENFLFQFHIVASFIDQKMTYLVSEKGSHLSLGIAISYLIHKGIPYQEAISQYEKASEFPNEYNEKLRLYDKYINMTHPDYYYKCNKCRTSLFDDSELIFLHEYTPKARYSYKRYKVSAVRTNECSSYFLKVINSNERLEIAENGNKILCIKCKNKIGEYHEKGSQCSCGSWVVPGIQIVKSKIDQIAYMNR